MSLKVTQLDAKYGFPEKNFTVRDRFSNGTYRVVEKVLEVELRQNIKSFFRVYGNSSVVEDLFIDAQGEEWKLASFSNNVDFMTLPREFKQAGWGSWLVFGNDPGGWHYCIDFNEKQEGGIFVNRWNDNRSPEDQFLKIANSFEAFIGGLSERTSGDN